MATAQQLALFRAAVRIGTAFGTGGAAWTGVRTTGGSPSVDVVDTALASRTIRFIENGMAKLSIAFPAIPVYQAPYVGVADIGVDIREGDVYTNGTIAFRITGTPDTSQGFQLIPAQLTVVPAGAQTADGWSL
jgi:hypothetical protein